MMKKLTRKQFEDRFSESAISAGVVIPCICGSQDCEGWALIPHRKSDANTRLAISEYVRQNFPATFVAFARDDIKAGQPVYRVGDFSIGGTIEVTGLKPDVV